MTAILGIDLRGLTILLPPFGVLNGTWVLVCSTLRDEIWIGCRSRGFGGLVPGLLRLGVLVVGGMVSCPSCPFFALYFFLVLRSRRALCFLLRSLFYGIAVKSVNGLGLSGFFVLAGIPIHSHR